MAATKLGRNYLRWCSPCNLPILESKTCPVCGGETFETPLTPPADSRPAFAFDIERVRKLADDTFGPGCGKAMLPDGHAVVMNKAPSIDRMEEIFCDGAVLTTIRYDLGKGWAFIVRLQGAFRIAGVATKGRVFLNPEAVPFIRESKNLMVPGVTGADDSIQPGDEVIMMLEDGTVIATGTAKMSGTDMKTSEKGVAVKTRWHKEEKPSLGDTAHSWEEIVRINAPVIEKRRDEAVGFINSTIAKNDLPAVVSFSGGKDSLATMLLTMDAGLKLRPMFLNTGLELDETVQYVHDFAKRHDLDLIETKAPDNAFFGNLVYFGPPAKDYRWCCKTNKLGPTSAMIAEHFPKGVLSFIGQRKFESEARKAKPRVWKNPWTAGQVGASPVQNWCAMHIWLYIFYKNEPYNVWYAKGLDRIGCFMCPASDMADLDTIKSASSRYPQWDEYLSEYQAKHGLPPEWKDYGLWRWKSAPPSVIAEIERVTGKKVPPMKTSSDLSDDDNSPVSIRVQDGYSPCTMGYSIEAALSRPIDLKKLEPFTHALGWIIELDENDNRLKANYVTFYGEGSITVKAFAENDAERQMDQACQLIARAFNCVGCGLCAARCKQDGAGCLYMEDGKVRIREDDCIFCRKCYGNCPAVIFAPSTKQAADKEAPDS